MTKLLTFLVLAPFAVACTAPIDESRDDRGPAPVVDRDEADDESAKTPAPVVEVRTKGTGTPKLDGASKDE